MSGSEPCLLWEDTLRMRLPHQILSSCLGSQNASLAPRVTEPLPAYSGHVASARNEHEISLYYFIPLRFWAHLLMKHNLAYTDWYILLTILCFLESTCNLIFWNSEENVPISIFQPISYSPLFFEMTDIISVSSSGICAHGLSGAGYLNLFKMTECFIIIYLSWTSTLS